MKKIFFLLCLPVCSWAQFSAGNKFIGGSVSINNQNGNVTSPYVSLAQNFGISPSMGFLVKDNLAVGFRLGYTKSYTDYNYGNISGYPKSNDYEAFSGGLFLRRYITISEKFLFAIDGSVNYIRGTTTNSYIGQTNSYITKQYNLTAQVAPLFIYFPSDHWGIEASLGSLYFTHMYNFITDKNANMFNLNYGSFSLGFAYYIR